jgi:hypothetical protein
MIEAFLKEFPQRPLRAMTTIEQALAKYVNRKLAGIHGPFAAAGVP